MLKNKEVQKLFDEILPNSYVGKYQEENFVVIEEGWTGLNTFVEEVNKLNHLKEDEEDILTEDDILNNWGFSDEYTTCDECGDIIRTSATHYGWKPDYWINNGSICCGKCIRNYPEEYIEHLTNNYHAANTILNSEALEEYGYIKLPEQYETGFHPGQNDSPEKIYNEIKNKYDSIIFEILDSGQFDIRWTIWVKNK